MNKKKLSISFGIFFLVLMVAALTLMNGVPDAGAAPEAKIMPFPKHVIIGTFRGAPMAVAQGICSLVQKEIGISAVPHTGRSTTQEIQLLSNKEVDMTLCQGDVGMTAFLGTKQYKEKGRKPIRLLSTLHVTFIHLATWPGTGIKSMPDTRGKRVDMQKLGIPSLAALGDALLEFHGMSRKDVTVQKHGSPKDALNALRNRTADLVIHFGSQGRSAMWMELTTMTDIIFLPMSKAEQQFVLKKATYFQPSVLPANTYKGQTKELHSVGTIVANIVHRDANDDFIYRLCKVMFDDVEWDKPGRLAKFHSHSGAITLKRALSSSGLMPFHAGAVKYYKERGVWTDEHEKTQKQMLAKVGESR